MTICMSVYHGILGCIVQKDGHCIVQKMHTQLLRVSYARCSKFGTHTPVYPNSADTYNLQDQGQQRQYSFSFPPIPYGIPTAGFH
jgi:hypothetical protein